MNREKTTSIRRDSSLPSGCRKHSRKLSCRQPDRSRKGNNSDPTLNLPPLIRALLIFEFRRTRDVDAERLKHKRACRLVRENWEQNVTVTATFCSQNFLSGAGCYKHSAPSGAKASIPPARVLLSSRVSFSWRCRSCCFRHSLLWFWFDRHFCFATPEGWITRHHFFRYITHLRTHCIDAGFAE